MAKQDASMKPGTGKAGQIILYIVLTILFLYTLTPLLFLLLNSFKSQAEIVRNPLALPEKFTFQYLINAFESIHFPQAIGYTLLITIVSVLLIVLVSSLCGWIITRHKSSASTFIYLMFVAAMLIPFQAVMYPLMNIMDALHLKNIPGLIIMYAGFGLSMSIFLYSGFFKSVPRGCRTVPMSSSHSRVPVPASSGPTDRGLGREADNRSISTFHLESSPSPWWT